MVICVDTRATDVALVSLRDLLYTILIFKSGFKELTLARKSLILINDSSADLSRIKSELHKYESDLELALLLHNEITGSFFLSTPPPSAHACAALVDVATKNEAMYKQTAKEEKTKIPKHQAQETIELLRDKKFALHAFKLNRQYTSPLVPKVADAIVMKYRRLFLRTKTKFHANQLKVEIGCLKSLILQRC